MKVEITESMCCNIFYIYIYFLVEEAKFHVIMFDVDSKDRQVGLSCPPTEFVSQQTVDSLKSFCLLNQGQLTSLFFLAFLLIDSLS